MSGPAHAKTPWQPARHPDNPDPDIYITGGDQSGATQSPPALLCYQKQSAGQTPPAIDKAGTTQPRT